MEDVKRIKYENILHHLKEAMCDMETEEALGEEAESVDFTLKIVEMALQREAHKEAPVLDECWRGREGTRYRIVGCTETRYGKMVIYYKAEKEDFDEKRFGFKVDPLLSMPLDLFLGRVPGETGEVEKWRFEIDV